MTSSTIVPTIATARITGVNTASMADPHDPRVRHSLTHKTDRNDERLIGDPSHPSRSDIDQNRPSTLSQVEELSLVRCET